MCAAASHDFSDIPYHRPRHAGATHMHGSMARLQVSIMAFDVARNKYLRCAKICRLTLMSLYCTGKAAHNPASLIHYDTVGPLRPLSAVHYVQRNKARERSTTFHSKCTDCDYKYIYDNSTTVELSYCNHAHDHGSTVTGHDIYPLNGPLVFRLVHILQGTVS